MAALDVGRGLGEAMLKAGLELQSWAGNVPVGL